MEVFGIAHEYVQEIRICHDCGFIFTGNPFDEELLSRYTKLSHYEYDSQSNTNVMGKNKFYKKRCQRQYDFIKNTIDRIDSFFEVGSASGYNLSLYHNVGINVFGIEPSENNVINCKKNYNIKLFHGTFHDYIVSDCDNRTYDMIFLSHVLEHIINPTQFLKSLSKMNNRYMYIEVPSFDYKFNDEPFGMFEEEHVNYFTFESLRNMMHDINYHIVDANLYFASEWDLPAGNPCLSTIWEKDIFDNSPSITKSKAPVLNSYELLKKYLEISECLQTKINEVIDSIDDNTKLAVWGTGHHTARLLGVSNLKNKNIVKFYDSDIRKKNIAYFGKIITQFNASDIINKEVDIILISSYMAQYDIIKNIKKYDIDYRYINLY
jgi:hypothetical protein